MGQGVANRPQEFTVSGADPEAMLQACWQLTSAGNLDQVAHRLLEAAPRLAEATYAALVLSSTASPKSRIVWVRPANDTSKAIQIPATLQPRSLPLGWVEQCQPPPQTFTTHQPHDHDPYWQDHHPSAAIGLSFPVHSQMWGLLYLEQEHSQGFSSQQQDLLRWLLNYTETRLQQLAQQSDLQDQLRTLEKRLLTTQTRLEQALKAAHMGAWEWDLLTDQERWWPEIEHLGSTGSHSDFLMRVHPEDRDRVMRTQMEAIQRRQPYQAVFRVMSSEGKVAWKSSQGTLLLNDKGDPVRMVGISADVTEQKQAEQALQEAVAAADAANRAKSSFLANMTHELRTPMNAILGFCQLLARDENLTPQQQQSLRVITRSGEHLLNQINAVLDMSKIEAGQITLQEQPCDLWGLLTELRDLFEPRVQAKLLQFQLTIGLEVPQILVVDATKLRQVLTNLLANALKFTHQGEITLSVTIEVQDQERYLCLVVQDTGEGISTEEIPQLFQPFVQSSSGIRSQQGTGLGLCICQQYVHLMGGSIALTSQLGQGSSFIIQIPCKCSITDQPPEERSVGISNLISRSPASGNDLVPRLALQPLGWRQELYQASLHLDRERVLHCIHTLSEEDADLAQILIQWVEDFRFDHLTDLLQILPHE